LCALLLLSGLLSLCDRTPEALRRHHALTQAILLLLLALIEPKGSRRAERLDLLRREIPLRQNASQCRVLCQVERK